MKLLMLLICSLIIPSQVIPMEKTKPAKQSDNGVDAELIQKGKPGAWGYKVDCVKLKSDVPITKCVVNGILYWYADKYDSEEVVLTLHDKIELDEVIAATGLPGGVSDDNPSLPTMTLTVFCGERKSTFTWNNRVVPPVEDQIPDGAY